MREQRILILVVFSDFLPVWFQLFNFDSFKKVPSCGACITCFSLNQYCCETLHSSVTSPPLFFTRVVRNQYFRDLKFGKTLVLFEVDYEGKIIWNSKHYPIPCQRS